MLESHFARMDDVSLEIVVNGSDALGQSITQNYDLILLDLHLPDVGGLGILPVLRGSLPRSVIAVISGYTELVTEEDYELADVVIPKPFELTLIDKLVEMTRDLVASRSRIKDLGIS